ncbi:MAG: sigma-70 family RNA polymerase sigma factor [Phycisphaerales bacterium]|nr:sigma-70 family RNA polymerase sigma factor [Phycisphaerales bacterium]
MGHDTSTNSSNDAYDAGEGTLDDIELHPMATDASFGAWRVQHFPELLQCCRRYYPEFSKIQLRAVFEKCAQRRAKLAARGFDSKRLRGYIITIALRDERKEIRILGWGSLHVSPMEFEPADTYPVQSDDDHFGRFSAALQSDQFDDTDRNILCLRIKMGLPWSEIVQLLGLKGGTARSRKSRLVKKLAVYFGTRGDLQRAFF